MAIFKGAGVAMATPMKEDGLINFDAMEKMIEYQIRNHTDAIIAEEHPERRQRWTMTNIWRQSGFASKSRRDGFQ